MSFGKKERKKEGFLAGLWCILSARVRKSRYWGETLQVPHPLLWRNEASILDQRRTMYFPLALFAYTVCYRRTEQCFSVLRTHKSDAVDGSSGRRYVTDQWHDVPLLRTHAIVNSLKDWSWCKQWHVVLIICDWLNNKHTQSWYL